MVWQEFNFGSVLGTNKNCGSLGLSGQCCSGRLVGHQIDVCFFQLKAGTQTSEMGHLTTIMAVKVKKKKKVFIAMSVPFLTECGVYNKAGERCILWYQEKIPNNLKIRRHWSCKQYPLSGLRSKLLRENTKLFQRDARAPAKELCFAPLIRKCLLLGFKRSWADPLLCELRSKRAREQQGCYQSLPECLRPALGQSLSASRCT